MQAAKEAAEKTEHHLKSQQNAAEDGENHPPPPEELLPEKLASTSDPLQEAIRFLQPLQSFSYNRIDTHLLAYEIYSRKSAFHVSCYCSALLCSYVVCSTAVLKSILIHFFGIADKPLLMLQSIKRAVKIDESNAKLHQFLSNFQDYIITR